MSDGYNSIVARLLLIHLAFLVIVPSFSPVAGQERPAKPPVEEQDPPEEDESLKPTEYTFNPLQAEKEVRVGNFYFKKGSFKAAARRYREATRWDPTSAEAYRRLGQAEEKLKDDKAAREAYAKYLEIAPDAKDAAAIRKKIERRP
jgi:tetratricopeptide (TPR) repeat protein